MEKRPMELSSDLKAGSRGASLTSKVPVAWWGMGVSFWAALSASMEIGRRSRSAARSLGFMFFSFGVDGGEKYNIKKRKDNAAAHRKPRFGEKKEKADR